MSNVQRNGIDHRPKWNYINTDSGNTQPGPRDILEMTESVRNTLEQIRDSQMLQCDVASAIKDMAKQISLLRRDLKRKRRKK